MYPTIWNNCIGLISLTNNIIYGNVYLYMYRIRIRTCTFVHVHDHATLLPLLWSWIIITWLPGLRAQELEILTGVEFDLMLYMELTFMTREFTFEYCCEEQRVRWVKIMQSWLHPAPSTGCPSKMRHTFLFSVLTIFKAPKFLRCFDSKLRVRLKCLISLNVINYMYMYMYCTKSVSDVRNVIILTLFWFRWRDLKLNDVLTSGVYRIQKHVFLTYQ